MGVSPEKAPDKATYITLSFEKGVPVALDGEKLDGVGMVEKLNKLGGENGIGLVDMVENRLVGMKSRGVYETPGGTILYQGARGAGDPLSRPGHPALQAADGGGQVLRSWCITASGSPLCGRPCPLLWTAPRSTVTGDVKLKLYKGNMILASVTSPYSLYDEEIATFDEDEVYDQMDSQGFINLFGLPIKVQALKQGRK